ncbi:hypothetical protein Tco_0568422 [Tanacetum coccineum]
MGDANHIRTLGDYSKPSHEGYRNTIELLEGKNVVPLRSDTIRRTIDQSADGKLCDRNDKESRALLEDLTLYDNESWNDPRDFAKLVKEISLPQDVPSTSNRRLIELENQVQRLMEAHLALMQSTQVNKITSSCEICSGPYDTQYCMKNPKQAFVEYASSHIDEAGGKWYTFKPEQNNLGDTYNPSWKSHPNLRWRQPQNSQNNFSNPPNRFQPNGSIPNRSFNNNPQNFNNQSNLEGLVSNFMAYQDARLSKFEADFKQQQSEMTNKIDTVLRAITDRIAGALPSDTIENPKLNQDDDLHIEKPVVSDNAGTRESEVEYFDVFPTRSELAYHKIVEDISSIIDPRLSQVVLGKPFVEISSTTHDPPEGVLRFTNRTNEVSYKMSHKIEQYNSLSDLEKEQTKSVYLRNEEDKRRRVEYVMSKILGFYKECLELRPEHMTGVDDEGEVT